MKIGILNSDTVQIDGAEEFGQYPEMFSKIFWSVDPNPPEAQKRARQEARFRQCVIASAGATRRSASRPGYRGRASALRTRVPPRGS